MFEVIERLKTEWTDKYVVIDSPAPELARFTDTTGVVKTVNMNGRCLVEFDQYNNTGWYDIDPSCLKIVPKPLPKPAEPKAKPAAKAPAAKPAAKAPAAKPAAAKAPAAKPAAGKRPSTADILAAARGKAAAPAAKPAGKMSTADILAAARGKQAAKAPAGPEPAAVEDAAPEPVAEAAPEPVVQAPKPPAAGPLPTTTAEKIAWCRANDAKG
jgi:hypothetical protein